MKKFTTCAYAAGIWWLFMFTLRIQLMATAPGVALFLDTPTEVNSVCVVKTPIAPPKKC